MEKLSSVVVIGLILIAGCTGPGLSSQQSSDETQTTTAVQTTTKTTTTSTETVYNYQNLSAENRADFKRILDGQGLRSRGEQLFAEKMDRDHEIRIRYKGDVYLISEDREIQPGYICYDEWSAVNESEVENSVGTLNESYANYSELSEDGKEAFLVPFENPEKLPCYNVSDDPIQQDFVKYNGSYYEPSLVQKTVAIFSYKIEKTSS